MQTIIVALVGNNEIVREGLSRILAEKQFRVDQSVSDVENLDTCLEAGSLVVVDANSFDEGLASCEQVRNRFSDVRIALMTNECDIDTVARAFATGAVDGYLLKQISCRPLAHALRMVAMGEKVLPSQIAHSLAGPAKNGHIRQPGIRPGDANLSSREFEILRCLVDGDSNKVISRRLQISDATVKVHIKAILRKLRVRNRTQAAIWAVSRELAGVPAGGQREALPLRTAA